MLANTAYILQIRKVYRLLFLKKNIRCWNVTVTTHFEEFWVLVIKVFCIYLICFQQESHKRLWSSERLFTVIKNWLTTRAKVSIYSKKQSGYSISCMWLNYICRVWLNYNRRRSAADSDLTCKDGRKLPLSFQTHSPLASAIVFVKIGTWLLCEGKNCQRKGITFTWKASHIGEHHTHDSHRFQQKRIAVFR